MKKILLLLAVTAMTMLSASTASAQRLTAGTMFFSPTLTNLGFNSVTISTDSDTESYSRVGLSISAGYALKDNLAAVGTIGFQSLSSDDSGISLTTIGAAAKYYFHKDFFATGGLQFGVGSAKTDGSSDSATSFGTVLGVGYSYPLSDKIDIEPGIGYYYGLSNKVKGGSINLSSLSINIGFSIRL